MTWVPSYSRAAEGRFNKKLFVSNYTWLMLLMRWRADQLAEARDGWSAGFRLSAQTPRDPASGPSSAHTGKRAGGFRRPGSCRLLRRARGKGKGTQVA